jgi:drug/metabolite transporter (DMT)-like permease
MFFSLAGTVLPVKTLVVAMIVTGVAVVVRPRPPSVRAATGQPSATWTGVGLALGGALLVAAALVSL